VLSKNQEDKSVPECINVGRVLIRRLEMLTGTGGGRISYFNSPFIVKTPKSQPSVPKTDLGRRLTSQEGIGWCVITLDFKVLLVA